MKLTNSEIANLIEIEKLNKTTSFLDYEQEGKILKILKTYASACIAKTFLNENDMERISDKYNHSALPDKYRLFFETILNSGEEESKVK